MQLESDLASHSLILRQNNRCTTIRFVRQDSRFSIRDVTFSFEMNLLSHIIIKNQDNKNHDISYCMKTYLNTF